MRNDYVNKVIKILLDLANTSDEKQETPFDRELGLGYRAFTSYVRKGVQEIVELQSKYYSACESRDLAKMSLEENEKMIVKVFGTTNVTEYNDEELARIKAVVDQIEKEWEEEE